MQGTVSTALRRAVCVPDVFCAEPEQRPLRHTDRLYNTDVSWGLAVLGVEGALASQSPAASRRLLNIPRCCLGLILASSSPCPLSSVGPPLEATYAKAAGAATRTCPEVEAGAGLGL